MVDLHIVMTQEVGTDTPVGVAKDIFKGSGYLLLGDNSSLYSPVTCLCHTQIEYIHPMVHLRLCKMRAGGGGL